MKAEFKKTNLRLLIGFLVLAFGWLITSIWVLLRSSTTTAGDVVACSLVTIIFLSFAAIPFLYNRKAYLHIDDNKLVGRFGFFKRIECDITNVTFVLAQFDTLHIILKDRKFHIRGIQNAYAISVFIQQRMPFSPCEVTAEVIENIKKRVEKRKKNIIGVFCMIGLSFAWIFIALPLIGVSKEFSDFTQREWGLFAILCAIELPTVMMMFVFAIRSGKGNLKFEKQMYELRRSIMESTPLVVGPGHLKAVLTDYQCSQRITFYCACVDNDPLSVCYNVEIFDENFKLKFTHQTEIFTLENFEEAVDGLLDITDQFI